MAPYYGAKLLLRSVSARLVKSSPLHCPSAFHFKIMPSSRFTISVTAKRDVGGRKYMEDYIAVKLSPNEKLKEIPGMMEQAFVGVFDGHGGKDAAKFAKKRLWETIQNQEKFKSLEVEDVKEAIKDAYIELDRAMLSHRCKFCIPFTY